jgi:threonylcarbamoyladenosine tRNA methylthiotransferase MtaB
MLKPCREAASTTVNAGTNFFLSLRSMQNNLKAAFYTLGCKLNFSETSAIAAQLSAAGFIKAEFNERADVYVINTCSVTENADRECKTIVHRALALNENAFIVVTGCYAQLKPNEIAKIPGVDLVLGANEKFNTVKFLSDLRKRQVTQVMACEINQVNHFQAAHSSGDRTRSFLKVQDGCDYSCSFCTIPLARGKSRSDQISNVTDRIYHLAEKGFQEIVLTGVNLGDFGKSTIDGKHEFNFTDLVKAIENLNLKIRIRISSVEPNLLNKTIIDLVGASEKFMPHFHIPLQSGSDKILRLMKRRYLSNLYADRITYIKNVIPNCCIGADVIVGFPGETDEDFYETVNFITSLDISYLHVFTYSERDHTAAAEMHGAVPLAIRKERNKILRILSDKKLNAFYDYQKDRLAKVLFESADKDGTISGYSENYIKVKAPADLFPENSLQDVRLTQRNESGNYFLEDSNILAVH